MNGLAQTLEFVAQTAQPMPSEQSSCFITIGFVPWHCRTSDKLSNNMAAEEYQHLGFVAVEYSFDTFEKHRTKLVSDQGISTRWNMARYGVMPHLRRELSCSIESAPLLETASSPPLRFHLHTRTVGMVDPRRQAGRHQQLQAARKRTTPSAHCLTRSFWKVSSHEKPRRLQKAR